MKDFCSEESDILMSDDDRHYVVVKVIDNGDDTNDDVELSPVSHCVAKA